MKAYQKSLIRAAILSALFVIGFSGLYLFRELAIGGQEGFPLDDSWIHVRVAENIDHGYGFSFNKGAQVPISTEPLWTVLLALVLPLSKNPVIAANVLGVSISLLVCIYSFKLTFLITADELVSSLAAIAPAFLPFLTWGSISGMGTPLFVLLTVMGIYYHVLFRRKTGLKQYIPTLVFVLAALSRPECFLLFGFSTLDYMWFATIRSRRPLREVMASVALHVLIFVVLTSPFFIFNYTMSKHLFPNTYYAKNILWLKLNEGKFQKTGEAWFYFSAWLKYAFNLFLFFLRGVGWLPGLLLPFGLYYLYKSRGLPEKRPGLGILSLVAFGYPFIASATNITTFGTSYIYGPQGRYFTNILTVWVILCALGVGTFKRRGRPLGQVALTVIALMFGVLAFKQWENSLTFAMNVKNINEMDVAVARWVDKNLPQNARLAVNDVGAIGRFSDREIIDILGLVNPDAWPYLERGQRGIFEYIQKTKPDYLIVFPKWFPLVVAQECFQPVCSVSINDNTIVGSDLIVVYKCDFERTN